MVEGPVKMNYLEGSEKFYDLFGEKNDAPFYLAQVRRRGGPALELGVGTARLAIQLARAGVEVWGIDNSPHMLKAAEANLAREPENVRLKVHLRDADARNFELPIRFGLIYFPSFSFDHLLTREAQLAALGNVKRHLAPGGVYAFDLAHVPEIKADDGWFVQRRPYGDGLTVVRVGYHKTNAEKRLMSMNIWYELYEDGRMLERYFEGSDVYIHTPDGVRRILSEAGFEVAELCGGYSGEPFTSGSPMIVIVARPIA
jgi:SAM-dependent methyltransferase